MWTSLGWSEELNGPRLRGKAASDVDVDVDADVDVDKSWSDELNGPRFEVRGSRIRAAAAPSGRVCRAAGFIFVRTWHVVRWRRRQMASGRDRW